MTLSSTIEAKASGREPSTIPADAVTAVARVQPKDQVGRSRLNTAAHWGYGTGWGIARAALDLLGLRGPTATAAHFGAVLGAEQTLLPALGVAKPTPAYGAAAAAADALHHAVYACVCGRAYDYLARR
jgi:hypothetical protein